MSPVQQVLPSVLCHFPLALKVQLSHLLGWSSQTILWVLPAFPYCRHFSTAAIIVHLPISPVVCESLERRQILSTSLSWQLINAWHRNTLNKCLSKWVDIIQCHCGSSQCAAIKMHLDSGVKFRTLSPLTSHFSYPSLSLLTPKLKPILFHECDLCAKAFFHACSHFFP